MRYRAHLIASLLVACSLMLPVAANASLADDGWTQLFTDRFVEARGSFSKAVHANPADVGAREGLMLVNAEEERMGDMLDQAVAICKLVPASAAAVDAWQFCLWGATSTSRYSELAVAARAVLASPTAPAQLKVAATLALADAQSSAGQFDQAAAARASVGFVRRWKVIGPFDNASNSGFEKPFGPEQQIAFNGSYSGKGDIAVTWHPLNLVDASGSADVSTALSGTSESVFYASSSVNSPSAQQALLTYAVEGACKVFVNGKQVVADPTVRPANDNPLQSVEVPVALRAGWNTVLVKLATDDTSTSTTFSLRFATLSGTPLRMSEDTEHAVTEPAVTGAPTAVQETWLAKFDRAKLSGIPSRYFLADALELSGNYATSEQVSSDALRDQPKASIFHEELSNAYRAESRTDEAKIEDETAATANPRIIATACQHLSDIDEQLTPADKIKAVKQILVVNPDSMTALSALADAYDDAKLSNEATSASKRIVLTCPSSPNIDRVYRRLSGDSKTIEARNWMDKWLKVYPNDATLLQFAASRAVDDNDVARADAFAQKALKIDPTATDVRQLAASLAYAKGDLAHARLVWLKARADQPQDASVAVSLADLEREMGHKAAAIDLYRDALRLDPTQIDLRDKIDVVSGSKPVIDLAPATPAQPILAKKAKAADYPGALAVALLDEERRVVYPDGGALGRYHSIVTIFDKSVVDVYSSIDLREDSMSSNVTVESARLIKADGTMQDDTDQSSDGVANFPSLAPGDTIDLAYRTTGRATGALAGKFWDDWNIATPGVFVKLSRYVLITPAGTNYTVRTHGDVPIATEKTTGSWKVAEWRADNVPPIVLEPMQPPLNDFGSWIDVSSVPDWSTIVKWYVDLSSSRCVPDDTVTAKAKELTKDAKTDTEKLHAIVNYVKAIQYQSSPFRLSAFVPTEGKKVIRERYADCKDKAALLTALLKAVGIKSEMVLLSGRSAGLVPFLPSPRFNHAIACVQGPDGPMFVDATADQMAFGDLPYDDQGVPCLLIDPQTTDLTTLPQLAPAKNGYDEKINAALAADGTLTMTYDAKGEGNNAWRLRSAFQRANGVPADQVMRVFMSALFKQLEFDSGSFDGVKDTDAPIKMDATLHASHFSTDAGEFLVCRLPWGERGTTDLRSYVSPKDRKHDLETATSSGSHIGVLTLKIPAGYVLQGVPTDAEKTTPYGSYSFKYSYADGILTVTEHDATDRMRVTLPELAAYLDYRTAIMQEFGKSIVLRKGP